MAIANNPILKGFYPDPSICRVGNDFYIVTSSFVYAPGVPIFHSRDLAHWEQIGHVLETEEQLKVSGDISDGIYAPTIRYHDGLFYMITTNVSYGGNFIVTAENPEGPWSKPYYLGDDAPGIDPSLFFDDDGRCYYVGTRPNPSGVCYNGDWEIWVQELDLKSMKLIGESAAIWKGAVKDVIWPEGPHIYKKDGYYYLLHAEGGTGPEHSISVARSKDIFKWFEGCPRNPIFSHRNLGKDYPIIYAGHGDLVDDENGNWYVVMLASRQCEKHCSMGRETFLAKVIWEDGWPVISPGIGRLEDKVEIPLETVRFSEENQWNDVIHFFDNTLDQRLVGIEKRNETIYSLEDRKGYLRLFAKQNRIEDEGYPAYLGLRQKDYSFEAGCGVEFEPKTNKDAAGLVLFQNSKNNLRMLVCNVEGKKVLRVSEWVKGKEINKRDYNLSSDGLLEIKLRAKNQHGQIWIKEETANAYVCVAEDINLLAYTTEEAGGFVGCTIGMYAASDSDDTYADFAWLSFLKDEN